MIQCLHGEIQVFMNKLASKFQPEMVRELKNDNLSFAKLDISLEKKKDDKNLTIGNITKPKLRNALDEGDISQSDVDKFYDAVKEFFKIAYTYGVKWLPLDDPLHKSGRFIEYSNREKFSFDDLTELLSLFPGRFGNNFFTKTGKYRTLFPNYSAQYCCWGAYFQYDCKK